MQIRNILVATDFSPDAERALEAAIDLAKMWEATIHVVHGCAVLVCPPADVTLGRIDGPANARAEAGARLRIVERELRDAQVRCRIHLCSDDAVSAILTLAESLPADLVALGTRGRNAVRHLLLGSVAGRVVRLAPCPVMTFRSHARSVYVYRPAAALR